MENIIDATYSPEDNKLRMRAAMRLDTELYQRVRTNGFIWAPKQELFVAPRWTPAREALCLELCGSIGDEDTSLVDRAEERAERFEEYSNKRANDAEAAHNGVKAIADNIPLGQPILIGHHSERRARKDAERIENGMRKAVKMWDTSEYWTQRAAGALRHAKYKELPQVRARRIKKIQAEKRSSERDTVRAQKFLALWTSEKHPLTWRRAKDISNYDHLYCCYPLVDYPREAPKSTYEGCMGLWSALGDTEELGIINADYAQRLAVKCHNSTIVWAAKWINHYNNRLAYEIAMLDEQGAKELIAKKPRPKQLPLLNYRASDGIYCQGRCYEKKDILLEQKEMSKAEYGAIYENSRYTLVVDNTHRVRVHSSYRGGSYGRVCVFITDSKTHAIPAKSNEPQKETLAQSVDKFMAKREGVTHKAPERTKFDDMRDTLKEGVKIVTAPQLFITPAHIIEKMLNYAGVTSFDRVLEPSAGTGEILRALPVGCAKVAVEINMELAKLCLNVSGVHMHNKDFLECNGELGLFDYVIMNPPFEKGADIKHIMHALTYLLPSGKLVALCANGSRQTEKLMPLATHWEVLPQGTFKQAGTMVNVALCVIDK